MASITCATSGCAKPVPGQYCAVPCRSSYCWVPGPSQWTSMELWEYYAILILLLRQELCWRPPRRRPSPQGTLYIHTQAHAHMQIPATSSTAKKTKNYQEDRSTKWGLTASLKYPISKSLRLEKGRHSVMCFKSNNIRKSFALLSDEIKKGIPIFTPSDRKAATCVM